MLALAPLAAATATAIPVNAMAVAFCAAGWELASGPLLLAVIQLYLVGWHFRLQGASKGSFVPGFFQGPLVPVEATSA